MRLADDGAAVPEPQRSRILHEPSAVGPVLAMRRLLLAAIGLTAFCIPAGASGDIGPKAVFFHTPSKNIACAYITGPATHPCCAATC